MKNIKLILFTADELNTLANNYTIASRFEAVASRRRRFEKLAKKYSWLALKRHFLDLIKF